MGDAGAKVARPSNIEKRLVTAMGGFPREDARTRRWKVELRRWFDILGLRLGSNTCRYADEGCGFKRALQSACGAELRRHQPGDRSGVPARFRRLRNVAPHRTGRDSQRVRESRNPAQVAPRSVSRRRLAGAFLRRQNSRGDLLKWRWMKT